MERKEEERVKREQAEIKLQYQMEHRAQMKKEGKANENKNQFFSVIKAESFFFRFYTYQPKKQSTRSKTNIFCFFYFSYSIFSSPKHNHHNYIYSLLFFNNS